MTGSHLIQKLQQNALHFTVRTRLGVETFGANGINPRSCESISQGHVRNGTNTFMMVSMLLVNIYIYHIYMPMNFLGKE